MCGLVGFGGGLALGFVVLVRLYRRLPAAVRSWVISEDEYDGTSYVALRRDPDADATTIQERLAAADARLTPDPEASARRDA